MNYFEKTLRRKANQQNAACDKKPRKKPKKRGKKKSKFCKILRAAQGKGRWPKGLTEGQLDSRIEGKTKGPFTGGKKRRQRRREEDAPLRRTSLGKARRSRT